MNKQQLKELIIGSLTDQGFRIEHGRLLPPQHSTKKQIRDLHRHAVQQRLAISAKMLAKHEETLACRLASGKEIDPSRLAPRLIEVRRHSSDELLFRYACLHWSVPVSSGYGRRLRFLVIDESNGKLIGVIGLGDPVFSLKARDEWIGWDSEIRRDRLRHVMDAYVLGAVPPYSFLLCGKLVAMLAASNEVRDAIRRKYAGSRALISRKRFDGRIALITTTSALGRSSIYNRLKFDGRLLYESVGFTRGYGEFHFINGLYGTVRKYAYKYCEATDRHERWGSGFRSRREVVKKCLMKVGLSSEWRHHGVQREMFVVPLAGNSREFLRGEHSRLHWFDQDVESLFAMFRQRWLVPRSQRDGRYRAWHPSEWVLWDGADGSTKRHFR